MHLKLDRGGSKLLNLVGSIGRCWLVRSLERSYRILIKYARAPKELIYWVSSISIFDYTVIGRMTAFFIG